MPRRRRSDYPGAWWHVFNRGVAKRELFECEADYRYFMALLAHAVRKGWIEIHAYCLMPNHFHLVVRSPNGDLSRAMQWIQDKYARWFNRRRDRDGPLFRGRFGAKLIQNQAYRHAVIGYTHRNPVEAGLSPTAAAYPYSSADAYRRPRARPWLSRKVGGRLERGVREGEVLSPGLVERWLERKAQSPREMDMLLGASPTRLRTWLSREARSADGPLPARFLVRATTLTLCLDARRAEQPDLCVTLRRKRRSAWDLVAAGLLRSLCALTLEEIARRLDLTVPAARGRIEAHRTALEADPRYARAAAKLLHDGLRQEFGGLMRTSRHNPAPAASPRRLANT